MINAWCQSNRVCPVDGCCLCPRTGSDGRRTRGKSTSVNGFVRTESICSSVLMRLESSLSPSVRSFSSLSTVAG